ncbi:MAG TPA: hypothetical protein VJH68_00170 [Candidatus Nanoarchaeia archaeon]|nr:hypothetical protein [Candidatus Nanoarchaeia archaeon]
MDVNFIRPDYNMHLTAETASLHNVYLFGKKVIYKCVGGKKICCAFFFLKAKLSTLLIKSSFSKKKTRKKSKNILKALRITAEAPFSARIKMAMRS